MPLRLAVWQEKNKAAKVENILRVSFAMSAAIDDYLGQLEAMNAEITELKHQTKAQKSQKKVLKQSKSAILLRIEAEVQFLWVVDNMDDLNNLDYFLYKSEAMAKCSKLLQDYPKTRVHMIGVEATPSWGIKKAVKRHLKYAK